VCNYVVRVVFCLCFLFGLNEQSRAATHFPVMCFRVGAEEEKTMMKPWIETLKKRHGISLLEGVLQIIPLLEISLPMQNYTATIL
ncbi:hypothetical protein KI387_029375, partial [Taxus chinensis]